jgi:hypothetical protein
MQQVAEYETHVEMTPVGQAVTHTQTDPRAYAGIARPQGEPWQSVIDVLHKWWNEPDYFNDEEFVAPLRPVLALAIKFATNLASRGFASPDRIVPDGDGGIVFELRSLTSSEKIHFWDDGSVEHMIFAGAKLVDRRPMRST